MRKFTHEMTDIDEDGRRTQHKRPSEETKAPNLQNSGQSLEDRKGCGHKKVECWAVSPHQPKMSRIMTKKSHVEDKGRMEQRHSAGPSRPRVGKLIYHRHHHQATVRNSAEKASHWKEDNNFTKRRDGRRLINAENPLGVQPPT